MVQKKINWNKWVAIGTLALAICAFIGLIISLWSAIISNQTANKLIDLQSSSDIEFKLSRLENFWNAEDLQRIRHVSNEEGLFPPNKETIGISYRNQGGKDSGPIHISLWDYNRIFVKSPYGLQEYIPNISSEGVGDITFEFRHPDCNHIFKEESEFAEAKEKCKNANISTGIVKWVLKLSCPFCKLEEEKREICYSFNTCFTNYSGFDLEDCDKQNKNWREEDLKELKECPLN